MQSCSPEESSEPEKKTATFMILKMVKQKKAVKPLGRTIRSNRQQPLDLLVSVSHSAMAANRLEGERKSLRAHPYHVRIEATDSSRLSMLRCIPKGNFCEANRLHVPRTSLNTPVNSSQPSFLLRQ